MNLNQRLYQVTALGRPFDLKDWSNVLILILTPVAGVVGSIYWLATETNNIFFALQFGFWLAASTFLAWALVRELAPDHPIAAFVGVAFAWGGLTASTIALTTPPPTATGSFQISVQNLPPPPLDWLALVAVLLYSRVVNRIVGPPPQFIDSVVVLTATLALALFDHWLLILVGIAAFLIDAFVPPRLPRHVAFALGGVVIIIARVAVQGVELPAASPATTPILLPVLLLIALITILYSGAIIVTNDVKSHPDIRELLRDDDPTNDPTPRQYELSVLRIRLTMGLALAAALMSFFWNGGFGVHWLLPLWAAMGAVGVVTLPTIVWTGIQQRRNRPAAAAPAAVIPAADAAQANVSGQGEASAANTETANAESESEQASDGTPAAVDPAAPEDTPPASERDS